MYNYRAVKFLSFGQKNLAQDVSNLEDTGYIDTMAKT